MKIENYKLQHKDGKYYYGGSLYLTGTEIKELPDNLSIGGSLDLRFTKIKQLPDNLSVNGSLYLSNTQINYPFEENCGENNRYIHLDFNDKTKIRIGCFIGNKDEAIKAVSNKYTGEDAEDYINKINNCFEKNKS